MPKGYCMDVLNYCPIFVLINQTSPIIHVLQWIRLVWLCQWRGKILSLLVQNLWPHGALVNIVPATVCFLWPLRSTVQPVHTRQYFPLLIKGFAAAHRLLYGPSHKKWIIQPSSRRTGYGLRKRTAAGSSKHRFRHTEIYPTSHISFQRQRQHLNR